MRLYKKTNERGVSGFLYTILTIVVSVLLSSCNGSGAGPGAGQSAAASGSGTATGVFLDSAVQGLTYKSGTISGVTGADGSFKYEVGKSVQFSIGGIVLGTTMGKAVITPINLVKAGDVSNPTVVNIARFLQTIDDDGNPSNGIQIPAELSNLAKGKSINFSQSESSFANDGKVQVLVSELTATTQAGARSLVSATAAETALSNSIAASTRSSGGTPAGTGALTVTGFSGATGGYTIDPSKTFVNNLADSGFIDWAGTGAKGAFTLTTFTGLLANARIGAVNATFYLGLSIFGCQYGDASPTLVACNSITVDSTSRRVSFKNTELVDLSGKNIIYLTGTLSY